MDEMISKVNLGDILGKVISSDFGSLAITICGILGAFSIYEQRKTERLIRECEYNRSYVSDQTGETKAADVADEENRTGMHQE